MLDPTTQGGRIHLFLVLPLVLGLITAFTGSLLPIFTLTLLFLMVPFHSRRSGGTFDSQAFIPAPETLRQDGVAGWWNRRRRFGFYVSFSVLLMWALAFTRSAVTDTWGGGDLLLAIMLVIPLIVIFRRPPQPVHHRSEESK